MYRKPVTKYTIYFKNYNLKPIYEYGYITKLRVLYIYCLKAYDYRIGFFKQYLNKPKGKLSQTCD